MAIGFSRIIGAAALLIPVLLHAQVPPSTFVNFEGAQTNPIRISSDGTRLFCGEHTEWHGIRVQFGAAGEPGANRGNSRGHRTGFGQY